MRDGSKCGVKTLDLEPSWIYTVDFISSIRYLNPSKIMSYRYLIRRTSEYIIFCAVDDCINLIGDFVRG